MPAEEERYYLRATQEDSSFSCRLSIVFFIPDFMEADFLIHFQKTFFRKTRKFEMVREIYWTTVVGFRIILTKVRNIWKIPETRYPSATRALHDVRDG